MAMGLGEAVECWGGGGGGRGLLILMTLASLLHNVAAEVRRRLDMAPNAVDVSYINCTKQMMELVTKSDGLLHQEFKASPDFASMWKIYNGTCKKQSPGFTWYHTTALETYGNSKGKFQKEFNQLVQTKGGNETVYVDQFPYKALHFLLTDAMRLANDGKNCFTVYYGTKNKYTVKPNAEVRFGRFLDTKKYSAALEDAVLEGGTLFVIKSCSAVNLDNFTCESEQVNILISPAEVFEVQSIQEKITEDKDEYEEINLTHSRFLTNHDCKFISRIAAESSSSVLNYSVLALILSVLLRCSVTD